MFYLHHHFLCDQRPLSFGWPVFPHLRLWSLNYFYLAEIKYWLLQICSVLVSDLSILPFWQDSNRIIESHELSYTNSILVPFFNSHQLPDCTTWPTLTHTIGTICNSHVTCQLICLWHVEDTGAPRRNRVTGSTRKLNTDSTQVQE